MHPHFRRLRRFRCRTTPVLAILLAMAGCAHPPAPPPVATLPEPPPPPPLRPPRPVLRAAWSFQATPDACVAQARAGATSLSVTIRESGPIRLTLVLPYNAPVHALARFSGPAGTWDARAGATFRHATSFFLPRRNAALGRILVLLSGGQFILDQPHAPILSLPESGAPGRQWFACARRSVNGT